MRLREPALEFRGTPLELLLGEAPARCLKTSLMGPLLARDPRAIGKLRRDAGDVVALAPDLDIYLPQGVSTSMISRSIAFFMTFAVVEAEGAGLLEEDPLSGPRPSGSTRTLMTVPGLVFFIWMGVSQTSWAPVCEKPLHDVVVELRVHVVDVSRDQARELLRLRGEVERLARDHPQQVGHARCPSCRPRTRSSRSSSAARSRSAAASVLMTAAPVGVTISVGIPRP